MKREDESMEAYTVRLVREDERKKVTNLMREIVDDVLGKFSPSGGKLIQRLDEIDAECEG